ncbi:hypothetical protein PGT21_023973 [Puccinia graminis f. sp. tritici]|uniref:Secreted protein n=1 Tax=Puccinia graminis f. sp. tritici TaxID=56615 RepID=A0A5B0MDY7_PUCGR|nr:hypothetical protein PGT21_023973 [Puccinia graminis f. sp. tritici]
MTPSTILIGVFIAFLPLAATTGVACAKEDCNFKYNAKPMYDDHPWLKLTKCGEDLGNEFCKNDRLKSYYKCEGCGCITIKNKPNMPGTSALCSHIGKRLFAIPKAPRIEENRSSSGSVAQASSSEGGIPFEFVGDGTVKMYKFL